MLSIELPKFAIGETIEWLIRWLIYHLAAVFDLVSNALNHVTGLLSSGLTAVPPLLLIIVCGFLIWLITSKTTAILSAVGLGLVLSIGLWLQLISTLTLVVVAVIIALLIGIPLGILMTRSSKFETVMRPVLDFMQTMPPFVYLIPAVMLFGIGVVPGLFATIIFSVPPPVRLTYLGITQVSEEMKEMAIAFGASDWQVLSKIELPLALPSIMAGVNQCIMLGISMVVIASMIGAGGLGAEVMRSVSRLDLALGFESGLAIVILAMVLDRVGRSFGSRKETPARKVIHFFRARYNRAKNSKSQVLGMTTANNEGGDT